MQDTEADRLGLQEGDQLLWVNGIDFQDIDHSQAVQVLKANPEVSMKVRYLCDTKYVSYLTTKYECQQQRDGQLGVRKINNEK